MTDVGEGPWGRGEGGGGGGGGGKRKKTEEGRKSYGRLKLGGGGAK